MHWADDSIELTLRAEILVVSKWLVSNLKDDESVGFDFIMGLVQSELHMFYQ